MMDAKVFEYKLKKIALEIREELAKIESISSMDLEITVEGRVHDGELKIEFKLGSSYSTGGLVKGGSIDAVVTEYKRRHGWDEQNAPLQLSYTEVEA